MRIPSIVPDPLVNFTMRANIITSAGSVSSRKPSKMRDDFAL